MRGAAGSWDGDRSRGGICLSAGLGVEKQQLQTLLEFLGVTQVGGMQFQGPGSTGIAPAQTWVQGSHPHGHKTVGQLSDKNLI